MISNTKDIKYLVISDIHLGKKDRTAEIVRNLNIFFSHYSTSSQFSDMDIIFIAGDLFDCLLDMAGEDIHEVSIWLGSLMHFCARHEIKLRILEGTPSHDWKQSRISETIAKLLEIPLDFKYIDTLYVEKFDDLNISCLYVPDEWTASTDLTLDQVKDLMESNNLAHVDIAIMHGMFGFQKPPAAHNIPCHDEASYLSLVTRFINIGHVHKYSTFERILAQGSFDRLAMGEEEPKGGIVCSLSNLHGDSFQFIENKGAKIYKTIVLKFKDLDKSLLQIERAINKIPNNSFVRIKATKDHPVYIAFDDLKVKFPMYNFTKKSLEDDEEDILVINKSIDLGADYTPITISKENVVDLLTTEICGKYTLTEKQLALLNKTLVDLL